MVFLGTYNRIPSCTKAVFNAEIASFEVSAS